MIELCLREKRSNASDRFIFLVGVFACGILEHESASGKVSPELKAPL